LKASGVVFLVFFILGLIVSEFAAAFWVSLILAIISFAVTEHREPKAPHVESEYEKEQERIRAREDYNEEYEDRQIRSGYTGKSVFGISSRKRK